MPRVMVRDLPSVADKVLVRIPRADDLELHVKLTKVDEAQFLNIREYVISRDWYGRGVVCPMDESDLTLLVGGIYAAADEAGIRIGV